MRCLALVLLASLTPALLSEHAGAGLSAGLAQEWVAGGLDSIQSAVLRPRVHIYEFPPSFDHLMSPRSHFGAAQLTDRLRSSPYYEPDHAKADFFWIPHQMPFRSYNWTETVYGYIRQTWPYLNASIAAGQTRHFITLTCDHGPSGCDYVERDATLGRLPGFFNPADPQRVVGHITFHGLQDGAAVGDPRCIVCFQPGKDIHVPVDDTNACGPRCGYSLKALRKASPFSRQNEARRLEMLTAARETLLFYAGRINIERATDGSGRVQLLEHAQLPGFKIINTHTAAESDRAKFRPFNEEMARSEFCYVPLGQNDGPPDRYVAAILFGCIPVMLRTARVDLWDRHPDRYLGNKQVPLTLPLEEAIDWSSFSVLVGMDELHALPELLGNVTLARRLRLRRGLLRVWRRLLYSSIFGPYMGEDADGHGDAFATLMQVLAKRARELPPLMT